MIIPLLDSGELVMERQYRYAMRRHCLEFPAGKIDPGEEALATGRRELLEETGYVAGEWTYLRHHPSHRRLLHRTHPDLSRARLGAQGRQSGRRRIPRSAHAAAGGAGSISCAQAKSPT